MVHVLKCEIKNRTGNHLPPTPEDQPFLHFFPHPAAPPRPRPAPPRPTPPHPPPHPTPPPHPAPPPPHPAPPHPSPPRPTPAPAPPHPTPPTPPRPAHPAPPHPRPTPPHPAPPRPAPPHPAPTPSRPTPPHPTPPRPTPPRPTPPHPAPPHPAPAPPHPTPPSFAEEVCRATPAPRRSTARRGRFWRPRLRPPGASGSSGASASAFSFLGACCGAAFVRFRWVSPFATCVVFFLSPPPRPLFGVALQENKKATGLIRGACSVAGFIQLLCASLIRH